MWGAGYVHIHDRLLLQEYPRSIDLSLVAYAGQ